MEEKRELGASVGLKDNGPCPRHANVSTTNLHVKPLELIPSRHCDYSMPIEIL